MSCVHVGRDGIDIIQTQASTHATTAITRNTCAHPWSTHTKRKHDQCDDTATYFVHDLYFVQIVSSTSGENSKTTANSQARGGGCPPTGSRAQSHTTDRHMKPGTMWSAVSKGAI
ncbi:unnamed protein product [Ectocarpus fasciculatus]